MHLDVTKLYGDAISQKLPKDYFEWRNDMYNFDEEFIKKYNINTNKRYILEVDIGYPKHLHNLHSNN